MEVLFGKDVAQAKPLKPSELDAVPNIKAVKCQKIFARKTAKVFHSIGDFK